MRIEIRLEGEWETLSPDHHRLRIGDLTARIDWNTRALKWQFAIYNKHTDEMRYLDGDRCLDNAKERAEQAIRDIYHAEHHGNGTWTTPRAV